MISSIFSNRLNTLRKSKGLTLEQLGNEVDMKKNTLSAIENANKPISLDAVIRLAEYFNVSIDYLIGRTDNPEINK